MEDAYLDSYWEDQIEMQAPYDDGDYLGDEDEDEDEGADEYEARSHFLESVGRGGFD
jgi:hypothetical protein